jgi:HEAT repeat protein
VHVVERVLELFLQKRDDPAWMRSAAALLKLSGSMGIGKAFFMLEEEQNTANRLALIRLIGRLGPGALDEARKSLKDERWFVARNACKLLGQLKDPELSVQLGPLLGHRDSRVQKAALDAIRESRDPKRGAVLADSLPFLHPQLRDEVLNELLFLRDPASIPSLDRLIFNDPKGTLQSRCTQILAAVPGPEAHRALLHVLSSPSLDTAARRIALTSLTKAKSPETEQAIRLYAESAKSDPLGPEMLALLKS